MSIQRTIIVVPTPQSYEKFKESEPSKTLDAIEQDENHSLQIEVIANNKTGISSIYNSVLAKYKDMTHITNVIFIHDDVEIHDKFFLKKVQKAHKRFDVVGLAGATSQDYKSIQNIPAWHLSMKNQKDGRGFVSHVIPKDVGGYPFPYINSSYFGPTPSEVVFVDGLFISFDMDKWRKNPITFDENYSFHHYDMSACAELHKAGYSIGVWPIFAIHYGLGEFADDILWQKLAKDFKTKYNNYSASI